MKHFLSALALWAIVPAAAYAQAAPAPAPKECCEKMKAEGKECCCKDMAKHDDKGQEMPAPSGEHGGHAH